jgi:hypothetical protein
MWGLFKHRASADSAIVALQPSDMFCAFPLICPKQKDIYTVNSFSELNLSAPLLKAIAAEGYDKPTPIQARAIPELLKGRDL